MNRWRDWYGQGKRDYERALIDVRYGYYEWACFTLQQSTEKVIKGLGLARGLMLWGHSLTEMLKWIEQETGSSSSDFRSGPIAGPVLHSAPVSERFRVGQAGRLLYRDAGTGGTECGGSNHPVL